MKMCKPKRLLAILLTVLLVAELLVTVIGTFAESPKTVTKSILDFSNTEVSTKNIRTDETKWPTGLSKLDDYEIGTTTFKYNYINNVYIAEDSDDGEKFIKFNISRNVNGRNHKYPGRATAGKIYLKASVPYWYINYLKSIELDYIYQVKENTSVSDSGIKYAMPVILGISNGKDKLGKDNSGASANDYADVLAPSATAVDQRGTMTKNISDFYMSSVGNANVSQFDTTVKYQASSQKWLSTDLANETKIDIIIMVGVPLIKSTEKDDFYFGIKNIKVKLEGPKEEIDNIDDDDYINENILDFENGSTVGDVTTNTASTFKFNVSGNSALSSDAHGGNNALKYVPYKGNSSSSAVHYDSRMEFSLKREVYRSKGITFFARNLGDKPIEFRVFIAVGNDPNTNKEQKDKGKYQAFVSIPANQTEYKRYSIFWNNVGKIDFVDGGEWWKMSGSGNSITDDERASGLKVRFTYPQGTSVSHAGVLFDDFQYITNKFINDRSATIVDFSNSNIGTELPENVTVSGGYEGTKEIIENSDGSKSLKFNYDAPAKGDTKSEMHHLRSRSYFRVNVAVPRGALDDVSELTVDITNNISGYDTSLAQTAPGKILYNIGIGDTTNALFGKQPEICAYVNFTGNKVFTQKPVGYLKTGDYGMTAWVDKAAASRWKEEDMKNIDMLYFYISAPDCDGTEGWSFQLNSIKVFYNEPSEYAEEAVREISHSDKVEALTSGNISANSVVVGTTDPNNVEFSTAFEVDVKDTANTEALVFTNEYSEYYRNMKPFYDKGTAQFHMFALSDKDLKFDVAVIDIDGNKLTFDAEVKAATTKLYNEVSVGIKDIYDAAVLADPTFKFDMTDIRKISILPVVTEACKFKIAGVTVLTGDYVSGANDPARQKFVNLVNFDNCEVGSKGDKVELPSNVTVSGYNGSKEIVRTADGSNALQVNFDKEFNYSTSSYNLNEGHQTNQRNNIYVRVSVPKGSLKGLKKIHYTLTNNALKLSEQTSTHLKSYYTIAATTGEGVFTKQGESAGIFTGQKGKTSKLSLNVETATTYNENYYLTSWCPGKITFDEKYKSEYTSIVIYMAVPNITSAMAKNGGYNFQINSIDLEFDSKPTYADEDATRYIVNGAARSLNSNNNDTITSKKVELTSSNINYRQFNHYYEVKAKAGNTAAVEVENSLSKFLRNAEPFLETATFRVFYKTETEMEAEITLINVNGEKLPFTVKLAKSKSDKFDECIINLKDIYEAFKTANPDSKFALTDITSIQILPLSTDKVFFSTLGLWSREPGAAGSPGNYYYALPDDSVRIEAYDYHIADDFTVKIDHLDIESTLSEFGTKLPAGAKPVGLVQVTLRNGKGEMKEPSGRFWVSIRLPAGTELKNIKLYEVFYDGSLVPIKHYVMDPNNYISCEDYFATKTYAIIIVPPVEESEDDYSYSPIVPDGDGDGEYIGTPSQQTIVKRYKRYKKAVAEDYTWLWILIAACSLVLLLGIGGIIFLIIFKKKKRKAAEGDVAQ